MDQQKVTLLDLPPEILEAIFAFLTPLGPRSAYSGWDAVLDPSYGHPFLTLPLVCTSISASLGRYLRHRILAYPATSRKTVKRQISSGTKPFSTTQLSNLYLDILANFCYVCGRRTTWRATMRRWVTCCLTCDRKLCPNKITMSEAMLKYGLKKFDLFGGEVPEFPRGGPTEDWYDCQPQPMGSWWLPVEGIIPQRKGLYYGCQNPSGLVAIIFDEREVVELARRKHGVEKIEDYFVMREERKRKRQEVVEENKAKRLARLM